MIREFAFGFADRHHFHPASKESEWGNIAKDTFMSLFCYDVDVIDYFEAEKTLAGYDGNIYMPKEFLLDVDGSSIDVAKNKTKQLIKILKNKQIPYNIYFSGRGFHVGIPGSAFRWNPSPNLHLKVKDELTKQGIFEYADSSVTDKTRIIRILHTRNNKSGLWKVPINEKELDLSPMQIRELASKPRKDYEIVELNIASPVFDVLERQVKKETKKYKENLGMNPDPANYPCISKMLEGSSFGNRHAIALRVSAWLRWRYPEHVVRVIMEDWRKRVTSKDHPFKESEMERIVTDCYKGHNGSGYRYGCMDNIMDKFCSSTCKLFASKKSQSLMSAKDMEKSLISFLQDDVKPIDLGAQYGQTFPIYPGELVILQAPPKSMKTMLLQNWVNYLKRPTYFLEMEMSPRQIWLRFLQIEKGWSQEAVTNYYRNPSNSIGDTYDWLTVDYAPCHAMELDKRITMLPIKPEIIVIDHIGLMQSKHSDINGKMEEISGALTEVAIKHNVIVFAICEITKQAFHEGMNIASVRGSFRIAYNASKILSLMAAKGKDGNVTNIMVKTEANREHGALKVRLTPNNLRLEKSKEIL